MNAKQKLVIEQVDRKLKSFKNLPDIPPAGWIHIIRTSLKMSLRQLALRLGITAASVREIENREKNGSITLKNLTDAAKALDMKFVYGLIPMHGSLKNMLDQKAEELARKIVLRTSNTMKLEDQAVSKERIEKNIKVLAAELKQEMPRYLWD
jgi:predicted DNA-binding mobile mystery protein A